MNAEDEDAPQLDLPDAETNFALVGPYKPAAGFELVPVPSQEVMQAGLHLRTGFMRDRKLVQLFDYPQGWQEGTVMRRCVRNGKPSNVYHDFCYSIRTQLKKEIRGLKPAEDPSGQWGRPSLPSAPPPLPTRGPGV